AMLAVGFHLWHGVWSALTTLGANGSGTRTGSRLTPLSWIVAAVITIGFLIPPWAILLGIVDREGQWTWLWTFTASATTSATRPRPAARSRSAGTSTAPT